MKSLYSNSSILTKLAAYLKPFFAGFGRQTTRQLIWIVIAMLAVGAVHSVRSLHTEFLSNLDLASLNSMYYALGYAKRPVRRLFARCLVHLARRAVPDHLRSAPFFLIIDDTLVPKFGRKFDHVGILFDHAAHDGQNYKNGHCFVCIVLSVPIAVSSSADQVRYLSIPLLLRLWEKGGPSKLQIAHDLLLELRDVPGSEGNYILLADSWYPKAPLLQILSEWPQLRFIGAVRSDTALFDLPPKRTGKRGRPRKRGERLTLMDIPLKACGIDGYVAGRRAVMTKLFGNRQVTAFVTCPAGGGSRRLFLSTMTSHDVRQLLDSRLPLLESENGEFLPMLFYRNRWAIEVIFYELKTFWSLEDYMVRSGCAIDLLLNLIVIAYSLTKLLPHIDRDFTVWRDLSAQQTRLRIGRLVWLRIFLFHWARALQNDKNPSRLERALAKRLGSYAKLL